MVDKISVVLPTYKPGNYIFNCLNSLLQQKVDKTKLEILIILNGCCEPYFTKLNNYINDNNKFDIKLIQTDMPGVSRARNIGITKSTGKYIHFVDDDDLILPGLYRIIKGEYEIYSFGYKRELANGKTKTYIPDTTERRFFKDYSSGKSRAQLWATIFKREFLINNNLSFNESASIGEDIDFLFRCHVLCKLSLYIKEVYYFYLYNKNSVSNRPFSEKFLSSLLLQKDFLEQIKEKDYYQDILMLTRMSIILKYRQYLKSKIRSKEFDDVFEAYHNEYFYTKCCLKANYRSVFVFFICNVWRVNKNLYEFILKVA